MNRTRSLGDPIRLRSPWRLSIVPISGAQPRDKVLIQVVGLLCARGFTERRSRAFAAVAVQRELRDHQDGASLFRNRAVHLSFAIFEDPKIRDLGGESRCGVLGVILPDAEKHANAGADAANNFFTGRN